MSTEPSFYALFRRSRYIRSEEEDQASNSRQNRKENYAVAAVAFALKHDEKLLRHFLETVCGISMQHGHVPTLEVQRFDHSDLVIKDGAGLWLAVVEFKIDAGVDDKQHPDSPAFLDADGYGTLIPDELEYRSFGQKHYIVLDDATTFADGPRNCLECKCRSWADLASATGSEVGLWADLLTSLGDLGVAAFQFRKLKNMNNAIHTRQAVAMHRTLSALASKLKFGASGSLDIDMEGDEAWYGRNIPLDRLLKHIYLRVNAGTKSIGWFGYQAGLDHMELAVRFCCESNEAADRMENYVRSMLQNGPAGRFERDGTAVAFLSNVNPSPGDAEWFESVFKALEDKNAPSKK